jgi:hypothetical protein
MWAHLGNNFVLDFHEDSLRDVQPSFEISTSLWGRSFNASNFIRPTNSLDVVSSYFLPAKLGGDHSLKFGYRWRSAHSTSINHRGGFIEARFRNGVASEADIYRDGNAIAHLNTNAFYIQDTFTKNRLTVNLGFRYDMQDDSANAADVPANPHFPTLMPAISFQGADAGVVWKDFSPRVGFTYDLTGDGRNIVSSSFATYFGQMSPGQLSSQLAATGAVFARYPWADANGDGFVQPAEVNTSGAPITKSTAYDPANPTSTTSPTRVDPDVKNDRTREFIVGFDRQLGSQMAVGASYIWRKYDRFLWNDRDNYSSANFSAVNFTPTTCPAGARCETVTYFQPNIAQPSPNLYTNQPDRWRDFNGMEFTLQKRMANRWSASASYAYNNAIDVWDSPNAYEDPTNIENTNGFQYAPEAAGSGIGNVFQNSKWAAKASGRVMLPWDVNVALSYLGRQGFPFPQSVLSPSRINGLGTIQVLLDPLGDVRLDNLHTLDFRVDKTVRLGNVTIIPALDVFNLTNTATIQAINRNQAAANANTVSGIIAPRVARFGVNVRW